MPVQPVSAAWLAAMSSGATTGLDVVIDVLSNGEPIPGYTELAVESLTVSASRSNAQRTTVSVILSTNQRNSWFPVPVDMSSPLAPNGNELSISAGFHYADGTTETCPLGIFPIVSVEDDATSEDIVLTVTADDRSWSISRRALLEPYTIPVDGDGNPTQTMDQAILALLEQNTSELPPIQYSIVPTTLMAPANTYSQGQDCWQGGMDLAAGCGYELFLNYAGNVAGQPIPDPTTSPVSWTFSDQGDGLLIVSGTRLLSADGVFNDYWVATANSDTATPTQAEAADTNMSSFTYIGGPFGRIPDFITSSVSDTIAAAQTEAALDLAQSIGQVDTIVLESVLNAAVLIDDVCLVTSSRLGVSGVRYVVDGFTSTFAIGGTTQYNLRRVIS